MHVATKEASIDVLKFLFQMGANKNAAVSLLQLGRVGSCIDAVSSPTNPGLLGGGVGTVHYLRNIFKWYCALATF